LGKAGFKLNLKKHWQTYRISDNYAGQRETSKSDRLDFEIEDDVEYELDQARDEEVDFGPNGKFEIKKTQVPNADIGIVSTTDQKCVSKKAHVGVKNETVYLSATSVTLPEMQMNVD